MIALVLQGKSADSEPRLERQLDAVAARLTHGPTESGLPVGK